MRTIMTISGAQEVVRSYLSATNLPLDMNLMDATGGYLFEVESIGDIAELPPFEDLEYADKLSDGSVFMYLVTSDSGGSSYHIPKAFVTSEIQNSMTE